MRDRSCRNELPLGLGKKGDERHKRSGFWAPRCVRHVSASGTPERQDAAGSGTRREAWASPGTPFGAHADRISKTEEVPLLSYSSSLSLCSPNGRTQQEAWGWRGLGSIAVDSLLSITEQSIDVYVWAERRYINDVTGIEKWCVLGTTRKAGAWGSCPRSVWTQLAQCPVFLLPSSLEFTKLIFRAVFLCLCSPVDVVWLLSFLLTNIYEVPTMARCCSRPWRDNSRQKVTQPNQCPPGTHRRPREADK